MKGFYLVNGDGADRSIKDLTEHAKVLAHQLLRHDDSSLGSELHKDRGRGVEGSVLGLHRLVALGGPSDSARS